MKDEDIIITATAVPLPVPSGAPSAPYVPATAPAATAPGLGLGAQQAKYPSYAQITPLNPQQMNQLKDQGYTGGLVSTLSSIANYFPLRIWVVDNSGSMNRSDGQRIVANSRNKTVKLVQCTRWNEIQETVEYHAQMAALLNAPTNFRLLNHPGSGPQEFSVADKGEGMVHDDVRVAKQTMSSAYPTGVTPLAEHVHHIREYVATIEYDLRNQGKRVAIILATDGLPTNSHGIGGFQERQEFVQALRSLEGLPVWVVVRLCTDEDEVVEFYNSIDSQLELSIEVLDDFISEAQEVHEFNPWLTYTLPLHRMREMGIPNRLFDLLDERKLTKTEVRDFCVLLFGQGNFDGAPDPETDFEGFMRTVTDLVSREEEQWDPVKRKMKPVLSVKKMNDMYGESGCSVM